MDFLDLKAQYQSIKKEIDGAIRRVLDSGVFIGGVEVENFEKEAAEFCGLKYALGLNSGTDALYLSLKALGVNTGDEVITTPFTFIATAEVIANLGARPVFVDIKSDTFNINPELIPEAITPKTKAIIPVHLFGQMADVAEIMAVAQKYQLSVVEDAAQAIGAKYQNKTAGSLGDLGCFSFFPSKNLSAFGDGGLVATDNTELADKIKLLKNHGSSAKEKYLNLILGINSRLDAIQAAVLAVKIKHLPKWSEKRGEIASYYSQNLGGIGDIKTPVIASERTHIFHQYTIRTKLRDRLHLYLKEKGIPTMIYYPLPLHLQPALSYLGYQKGDLPEAERASQEVLSLPIYPEIAFSNQKDIIKAISEFFERC